MVGLSNALTPGMMDLTSAPNTSLKTKDVEKIKQTAQDFEAFFISRTMESMYEGVSTDGLFGGGHAEKVYRSLLLNEYGKAMAQTGTIGVADYVMNTIMKMQEEQSTGV